MHTPCSVGRDSVLEYSTVPDTAQAPIFFFFALCNPFPRIREVQMWRRVLNRTVHLRYSVGAGVGRAARGESSTMVGANGFK